MAQDVLLLENFSPIQMQSPGAYRKFGLWGRYDLLTMWKQERSTDDEVQAMNENQAERLVLAFEKMADTLQKWYISDHPEKKAPSEPTITYVKDETEQMLEDQGQTGEETTEEWTTLGPREREFLGKK